MNRIFIVILIICASIAASAAQNQGVYEIAQWEVSQDEAVRTYFQTPEFTALSFNSVKEFDNRIYSHLVSVDPDIASKLVVIRSKSSPIRDLLFIEGKLYSVLERPGALDALRFKTLFVAMKDSYGLPQMTKENDYTVYTYKTDKTQALLLAKTVGDRFETKVYLYAPSIFRRLFLAQ
jgi:hypothetical protein